MNRTRTSNVSENIQNAFSGLSNHVQSLQSGSTNDVNIFTAENSKITVGRNFSQSVATSIDLTAAFQTMQTSMAQTELSNSLTQAAKSRTEGIALLNSASSENANRSLASSMTSITTSVANNCIISASRKNIVELRGSTLDVGEDFSQEITGDLTSSCTASATQNNSTVTTADNHVQNTAAATSVGIHIDFALMLGLIVGGLVAAGFIAVMALKIVTGPDKALMMERLITKGAAIAVTLAGAAIAARGGVMHLELEQNPEKFENVQMTVQGFAPDLLSCARNVHRSVVVRCTAPANINISDVSADVCGEIMMSDRPASKDGYTATVSVDNWAQEWGDRSRLPIQTFITPHNIGTRCQIDPECQAADFEFSFNRSTREMTFRSRFFDSMRSVPCQAGNVSDRVPSMHCTRSNRRLKQSDWFANLQLRAFVAEQGRNAVRLSGTNVNTRLGPFSDDEEFEETMEAIRLALVHEDGSEEEATERLIAANSREYPAWMTSSNSELYIATTTCEGGGIGAANGDFQTAFAFIDVNGAGDRLVAPAPSNNPDIAHSRMVTLDQQCRDQLKGDVYSEVFAPRGATGEALTIDMSEEARRFAAGRVTIQPCPGELNVSGVLRRNFPRGSRLDQLIRQPGNTLNDETLCARSQANQCPDQRFMFLGEPGRNRQAFESSPRWAVYRTNLDAIQLPPEMQMQGMLIVGAAVMVAGVFFFYRVSGDNDVQ